MPGAAPTAVLVNHPPTATGADRGRRAGRRTPRRGTGAPRRGGALRRQPLAPACRWTWRAPRTAILLWQLLALSLAGSLVGLCLAVGLAPYRTGELRALVRWAPAAMAGDQPVALAAGNLVAVLAVLAGLASAAGFAWLVGWQLATVTRARLRHRSRLSLVASTDPGFPGLLLVDYPATLAYCLPGRCRAIVVSAGTVDRLDSGQIAAVLDHERAHLAERHDLVLLPLPRCAGRCRAPGSPPGPPRRRRGVLAIAVAFAAVSLYLLP